MSDSAAVTQIAGSTNTSTGTVQAPYAVRAIDIDFALGPGSYGQGPGAPTKFSIKGGRVSATIQHAQVPQAGGNCIALIYGLNRDTMNTLSKAGLQWDTRQNEMVISAGDALTGMTTVFKGIVQEAFPAFHQPDAPFFVRASPGTLAQLKPVEPLSYPGQVDVATALATMAKNAGWALENNGVSVQLASPYFSGTTWTQIVAACRAANIYAAIDSVSGVLAIWPKTGSRNGAAVVISPETGAIGYPQFSQAKVTVRTLFTEQVRLLTKGTGLKINVKSELTAANGDLTVSAVTFNLESQKPGGLWEAQIDAYRQLFGQGGS